jgi:ubiquinone/menaquinone biosynthesis C-methylase UbiE
MNQSYKDTFQGTAWYYARYREGYPPELFELVKRKFDLKNEDRVLDLGCGTGKIAIPVSRFVQEVVAMDPEPEMISEGRGQATTRGIKNIVWINAGSADLPGLKGSTGSFKLVTMGTSFHWMDREQVLKDLFDIIADGGGLVITWNNSIWTKEQNDWQPAVKDVIKKYLGEKRRAGSGVYQIAPIRHEKFVAESKFKQMEMWKQHWIMSLTTDQVIGNLYSTSMANPAVLGKMKEAFETELRETLMKLKPEGVFSSESDVEAILAWKREE